MPNQYDAHAPHGPREPFRQGALNGKHGCVNPDRSADDCSDQLPLLSAVGRGIKGNSAKVDIVDEDSDCETYLIAYDYDEATGEWTEVWNGKTGEGVEDEEIININGGKLLCYYNLRPYTIPQTFTITFIYRRPNRPEWSWTTPAIPYVWSVDNDGNIVDGTVGSGVATIFLKTLTGEDNDWAEYLVYPDGTTREDFNAPEQGEAWTSNITFGIGGDIECVTLDDISKILSVPIANIRYLVENKDLDYSDVYGKGNGVDGYLGQDMRDWTESSIIGGDKAVIGHLHADLGWDDLRADDSTDNTATAADGSTITYNTVKDYIDKLLAILKNYVNAGDDDLLTHLHEDLGWDDLDGDDDTDNTATAADGSTITYNNVKEYIDKLIAALKTYMTDHLHADLGWDDLDGDDSTDNSETNDYGTFTYNNVKEYIDNFFDIYNDYITNYISVMLGVDSGTQLTYGTDYTFELFNSWEVTSYPYVYVTEVGDGTYLVRTRTVATSGSPAYLSHTSAITTSSSYPSVCFKHGLSSSDSDVRVNRSRLYGIKFLGDYAFLNDATFQTSSTRTNTTEYINTPSAYHMSWSLTSYFEDLDSDSGNSSFMSNSALVVGLSSYFDGYNIQFDANSTYDSSFYVSGCCVDRQCYAIV